MSFGLEKHRDLPKDPWGRKVSARRSPAKEGQRKRALAGFPENKRGQESGPTGQPDRGRKKGATKTVE